MPHDEYRVRVTKDYLVFSAAHFITFGGQTCERLHGHNYRVVADVWGALDENYYVVDFIALRDQLAKIVLELDHHVLLPTLHSLIHVHVNGNEVVATFEQKRWVFPQEDCILLPIANTTTELLARYIGERLLSEMERPSAGRPPRLRIAVDENHGQWGIWEWRAT